MAENEEEGIHRRDPDEQQSERRPRRDDNYDDDDGDARRRRRGRDNDDDDDDRRFRRRDEGYGSSWIPYKNPMALTAYYCGVFGLISVFLCLGIFGIVPIVFGFLGLKHVKKHPEAGGTGHAITGIVLGSIELLTFLAAIVFIVVIANSR